MTAERVKAGWKKSLRILMIAAAFTATLLLGTASAEAKTAISSLELSSPRGAADSFYIPYAGYTYDGCTINVVKGEPAKVHSGKWVEAGKTDPVTTFTVGKTYQYVLSAEIYGSDSEAYDFMPSAGLTVTMNGETWNADWDSITRNGSSVKITIYSPTYKIAKPIKTLELIQTQPLDPIIGDTYLYPGFRGFPAGVYMSKSEWYRKKEDNTLVRVGGSGFRYEKGVYVVKVTFSAYTGRSGNTVASAFFDENVRIQFDRYDENWTMESYKISWDSLATYADVVMSCEFVVGDDQPGTLFSHTDETKHGKFDPFVYRVLSTSPAEVGVFDYNTTEIIDDDYEIPETVVHNGITYTVTSIEEAAFSGLKGAASLTGIHIPSTIRHIGKYAFLGCPNLTRVYIAPSGADMQIEDEAFMDCGKLVNVYLPDRVKQIGEKAFGYNKTGTGLINGFSLNASAASAASTYAEQNSIPFAAKKLINETITLDAAPIIPAVGESGKMLQLPSEEKRYRIAMQMWYEFNSEGEMNQLKGAFQAGCPYGYELVLVPAEGYLFSKDTTVILKNYDWYADKIVFSDQDIEKESEGEIPAGSLIYMGAVEFLDLGEFVVDLTEGILTVSDEKAMSAIENTNKALIHEGQVKYIATDSVLNHMYDVDMDADHSPDILISTVVDDASKFVKATVTKLGSCSESGERLFKLDESSIKTLKGNGVPFYSRLSIVFNKRDISKAVISQIPEQTYTGAALTPDFTVTYGGKTLVKDVDYTVAYSDNTKAGTAKITITGMGIYEKSARTSFVIKEAATSDPGKEDPEKIIGYAKVPEKGDKVYDDKDEAVFEITADPSGNTEGTVTYVVNSTQNATTITIAPDVTIHGKKYKVTEIAEGAFKNNKKLKKIIIGKNIKKIGKQAFFGCKSLKTIIIKTTMLKKNTVGAKAFTGIHKKATAKVPAKKLKLYRKVLTKKGMNGKKQKIKAGAK